MPDMGSFDPENIPDMQLVMACLIIYLDSYSSCTAFKEEIGKAVILINIIEVMLRMVLS